MAKFNPGLLIVLLLIGFVVFAYAGTKKENNATEAGWNLNDLIPSNAGRAAGLFGVVLLAVYGLSAFYGLLTTFTYSDPIGHGDM